MKIKDILQRDPSTHPLINQGQARISDKTSEKVLDELRGELATFVCEGQYADGIQRILSSYLTNLSQTNQRAAWVSGFFGSGKSHLLKVLCHLWVDTKFPDGSTARSLVPSLPDEIRNLLRELDVAGKRSGGLVAAAGALPGGTTDHVRLTILSVLLRGVGFPDQYPQAQFCLWLHDQGWLEKVQKEVEAAGKVWSSELNNLYVSGHMARAIMACDPNFAATESDARNTIKTQFPPRNTDITTEEFLLTFKRVLKYAGRDGRMPCTILVLDEVQQYIGDSSDRSTFITEVTEAVSKQLDSHVLVVASGQSALTATQKLQKLMDRYTIRVQLSDQDVEAVIRKVLLQKKPASINTVRDFIEKHAGEVSRQLQGTRIGEAPEDRTVIVDDYPLLPVRRRFWEHCFRSVDAAGTQSQLRSQLRIIHDAVAKLSAQNLGAVVPCDELFEALAPEMVNTGVLLREINERIIGLSQDGSEEGQLARRICGLVFLIGKLPTAAGSDIGVKASKDHIADLLVSDITADNGKLRSLVGSTLEKLSSNGVLMKVGDEYRLQTKEGAEWDREFRNCQTKMTNDDADIQMHRDQLLYAEADRIIRLVKITHGLAKEARQISVSRDQTPPVPDGECIPLWIRDQWSCSLKEIEDAARAAGTDSPTIYVFIPKQAPNDLKSVIVEAESAKHTLDMKGVPTTSEGQEARRSMESRRDLAMKQCQDLVKQIVANAKVFQGGGSELLQIELQDKIRDGAEAALARLFPRFKESDSSAWESVIRRAKEGADQPLQVVGHSGPTEQHPVCQQVISTIGSGKLGNDVRKALRISPFGWPQDAIDAALIALHRAQHVSATLNGALLSPGQLDQAKISKSEFRVEQVTLGVQDRLLIRRLYQKMDMTCKSGEELSKAPDFLNNLLSLAHSAGGEPPLPIRPVTTDIEDLTARVGNDQLAGIRDISADLEEKIESWKKTKELVDARLPVWTSMEKLAVHAMGLSSAQECLEQMEAIKTQRLLLEATDPLPPLKKTLSEALRKELKSVHSALEKGFATGMSRLGDNPLWKKLKDNVRADILANVGLIAPAPIDVSTEDALLMTLESQNLSARRAEVDAIEGRIARALEYAARALEPTVRPISMERATLSTKEDVDRWIERQRETLMSAIGDGPVLVN